MVLLYKDDPSGPDLHINHDCIDLKFSFSSENVIMAAKSNKGKVLSPRAHLDTSWPSFNTTMCRNYREHHEL